MDASRFTAYEDGYLFKTAAPGKLNAFQRAFIPASPGFVGDEYRVYAQNHPELKKQYTQLRQEYFDMAAADLNKDWLLGMLTDETKRKWFSGGAGALLGAGIGGLMGGAQGALMGTFLGGLAAFVMDVFDIGLPKAYEALFEARSKGKFKEFIQNTKAAGEAKGIDMQKKMYYQNVLDIDNSANETEAQKIGNMNSVSEMKRIASATNRKGEERQAGGYLRKARREAEKNWVDKTVENAKAGFGKDMDEIDMNTSLKGAYTKDIAALVKRKAELELERAKIRKSKGNTKSVDKKLRLLQNRLNDTVEHAERGVPGYEYSRDKRNWLPFTGEGFSLFGESKVGKLPDFETAARNTNSWEDLVALSDEYRDTMERARRYYYGQDPYEMNKFYEGWFETPSGNDPNESRVPFSKRYAGWHPKYRDEKELRNLARKLGLRKLWKDRKPFPGVEALLADQTKKRLMRDKIQREQPGSVNAMMHGRMGTYEPPKVTKNKGAAPKAVQDKARKEGEAMVRELIPDNNDEWKEFAGDDTPMWWECLTDKHASEPYTTQGVLDKLRKRTAARTKAGGVPPVVTAHPGAAPKALQDRATLQGNAVARSLVSTPEENRKWQEFSKPDPTPTPSPRTSPLFSPKAPRKSNNMFKEFSGNETPMWWECLTDKHAALPQDPGAMIPEQPQQQSGPDPSEVFRHQAKVTEMKAQAALEQSKADADVKKKQAEMNLSGQQAGIDMNNKRMDMQNEQVGQAQQMASAQNPAVNQSPQQPTATLQQPTAAGPAMASPTPMPAPNNMVG